MNSINPKSNENKKKELIIFLGLSNIKANATSP